jgi:hypothetical protein
MRRRNYGIMLITRGGGLTATAVEQRSQITGDHKSLAAKTKQGGRIFID